MHYSQLFKFPSSSCTHNFSTNFLALGSAQWLKTIAIRDACSTMDFFFNYFHPYFLGNVMGHFFSNTLLKKLPLCFTFTLIPHLAIFLATFNWCIRQLMMKSSKLIYIGTIFTPVCANGTTKKWFIMTICEVLWWKQSRSWTKVKVVKWC